MLRDLLEDTIARLFGCMGDDKVQTSDVIFRLMTFEDWTKSTKISNVKPLIELSTDRRCYFVEVIQNKDDNSDIVGIVIPAIIEDTLIVYYEDFGNRLIGLYASLLANLMLLEEFGSKLSKSKSVPIKSVLELRG